MIWHINAMINQKDTNNSFCVTKRHSFAQAGASLGILYIVAGSFIDLNIFSIGSFAFSFQKGLALVFIPYVLVLIGRMHISKSLILFFLMFALAFLIYYVSSGSLADPFFLKGGIVLIIGFVTAVILHTSLVEHRNGIYYFMNCWIILACISSLIAVGQSFDVVPLFFVPEEFLAWRRTGIEGIYRGVAFKYDPNFLAMLLTLGVGFALFLGRRIRWFVIILLMAGILATFSRMGLLVALAVIFTGVLLEMILINKRRPVTVIIYIVFSLLIVLSVIFFLVITNLMPTYIHERYVSIIYAAKDAYSLKVEAPDINLPSETERVLLSKSALAIIMDKPVFGVGAYREREEMAAKIDIDKSSHNVFLDLIMVGGIMGWLSLGYYIKNVWSKMGNVFRSTFFHEGKNKKMILIIGTQLFAYSLMGCFLSYVYYPILWFPLVFVVALENISIREQFCK